ncbi:hypothetical protein PROFUN_16269, partial [Planoprotostelium fungivorum]
SSAGKLLYNNGLNFVDVSQTLSKHKVPDDGAKTLSRTQSYTSADWASAYMEQQNELVMVAEMGRTLLEKSVKDDGIIAKMKQETEELSARLTSVESQMHHLKDHNGRLERRVEAADELNASVMKELEEKQEEFRLKLTEHRVNAFLLEVYKLELYKKNQDEDEYKFAIRKLKKRKRDLKQELQRMSETMQSKSGKDLEMLSMSTELTETRQRCGQLEQQVYKRGRDLEDMHMQREILQSEIDRLLRTNQEMAQSISQKSNQIKDMHKQMEEMQMNDVPSEENHNSGFKGSIFSELERQINNEKERTANKLLRAESIRNIKKISSRSEVSIVEEARDKKKDVPETNSLYHSPATEEYFYLTCSAIKVNIAFKDKSENVFLVRDDELFAQASAQKIPFHEWHQWLEQQFSARSAEPSVRPKSLGPTVSVSNLKRTTSKSNSRKR